jgi:hypothetical protein
VPRHRESSQTSRWGRVGIRVAATLTLLLGVAGGLYLDDIRADQAVANEQQALRDAEQAELALIRSDYVAWSRKMAEERADDERYAQEQAAAVAAAEAARIKAEEEAKRKARPTAPTSTTPNYPIPASCAEFTGNRGIGCALMLEAGYGLDQFPCLERLWTKESGWNHLSHNKGSGAYGIPQALPGSKMASFGADWQTNAVTQIKWGLSYIKGRYSTPCGAWGTFQSKGWY